MHILFLSGEYPLWTSGGVGTFIQTLGRALVKAGHSVTVLGQGKEKEEVYLEDEGVKIYRLPKNTGKLPNFVFNAMQLNRKLKTLQKQQPISIIESAEGGLAFLSKKHPAKKVIRLHGGHHFFAEAEKRAINWRKGKLEKLSFAKANGFIAISNYVKNHTEKYLSYRNKPVTIINLPVGVPSQQQECHVNPDRILFAGTICEKKGVKELIEAFQLVKAKYPEKQLDLFGREWFYPDGTTFEAELRNKFPKEYFENVHFHGAIPRAELDQKYAEAAFCVFPSHMETQGLVSVEAMALAKPVIFSQYGPGPETIEHGENGLLCDVYNPKDIADNIIWCIEHSEEAKTLGEKGRTVVAEKYDPSSILQQNLDFYQSLLDTN
ncbi:glycosyltransferase family 4 protein [Aureisphaera galaxeae]|uniref:glycosyltransferase family 4 protein n=1 Tax=Aureisphaera galaxeae TaxID=1538023 RepID=UPI002350A9B0|nr:glycosyltransferase family 4 protein [Aureisphaera galaxeae]MDC8006305.1 glycosyltransferase family 4 protein [Aureisphaera galaxeae]